MLKNSIVREMQIKFTVRSYLIHVRLAIIKKKTGKNKYAWAEIGTLVHCWCEYKAAMENFM